MAQNKKKTTSSRSKKTSTSKSRRTNQKKQTDRSFISSEIMIWIMLALCIFMMISNFGFGGAVGDVVAGMLKNCFGLIAYVFPVLLFVGIAFAVENVGNTIAYVKLGSAIVFTIFTCVLLQSLFQKGGYVGQGIFDLFSPAIGVFGTNLLVLVILIICAVLITEKSVLGGMHKGSKAAYSHAKSDLEKRKQFAEEKRIEKENRREQKRARVEEENLLKRSSRQVSGVSFDTTIEGEKTDVPKKLTGAKEKTKPTEKRTKTDKVESFMDPQHAMLQQALAQPETQSAVSTKSVEDLVIKRAMPAAVKELEPEPAESMAEAPKAAKKEKVDVCQEVENVEKSITEAKKPISEYHFPPINLLKKGSGHGGDSDAHLRETAAKLQKTLGTFGVNVTVTDISCGPAVTRYELQPEMGVKVSKIVGLADDIKLNLAAADIRIEAPIPGKAAVGIEVPNKENTAVMLRDILESQEFKQSKSKISFATGRDIAGKAVVSDIAKMPHVLVAGATGSGKSVCINTIIMSILYKARPDEVKLIMVDPKVVELSVYNGIPHLMIPVVTDPKKAAGALNWAVAEMDKRYRLFAEYNVRDLKGFNERVENIKDIEDEEKPEKMPQIVIIVDELADLMMVAPGDVEEAICRLAQLARAAGIHLVLATQRPSVNVITGLIKANMPSRIAFSVSSGVDSRTIIDMNGAEKLLGKGDMLFYPAGYQKPVRVQGAFVSDDEVHAVVSYLKSNMGEAVYDEEIQNQVNISNSAAVAGGESERDTYFVDAGKFIIEKDKASIGMLQRVFKIGFNRAARIMDQLADAGVVGPEEGTKPRKVLMSMEEFEQYIEDYV